MSEEIAMCRLRWKASVDVPLPMSIARICADPPGTKVNPGDTVYIDPCVLLSFLALICARVKIPGGERDHMLAEFYRYQSAANPTGESNTVPG
jgi:hypothetical protein